MATRMNHALRVLMAALLAGCTNYGQLPALSSAPANEEYATLYTCSNPDHFEDDAKFSIVLHYQKYQFVRWESPSSTYNLNVVFHGPANGGGGGKIFESEGTEKLLKVQEDPGGAILTILRNPPEQLTCDRAR